MGVDNNNIGIYILLPPQAEKRGARHRGKWQLIREGRFHSHFIYTVWHHELFIFPPFMATVQIPIDYDPPIAPSAGSDNDTYAGSSVTSSIMDSSSLPIVGIGHRNKDWTANAISKAGTTLTVKPSDIISQYHTIYERNNKSLTTPTATASTPVSMASMAGSVLPLRGSGYKRMNIMVDGSMVATMVVDDHIYFIYYNIIEVLNMYTGNIYIYTMLAHDYVI